VEIGCKSRLKVHKIEIFFGFYFEICIISLLVMPKYKDFTKKNFDQAIIGGDTIFPLRLRLRGIKLDILTPNQHIKSSLEHLID
jgi:hypothetical protein